MLVNVSVKTSVSVNDYSVSVVNVSESVSVKRVDGVSGQEKENFHINICVAILLRQNELSFACALVYFSFPLSRDCLSIFFCCAVRSC